MLRFLRYAFAAVVIVLPQAAYAQCVQVAPDVCIIKKSYNAPVEEQPFYGFADKTPAMIDADRKFVLEVVTKFSKEKGFEHSLSRATEALASNDFATAARRFNQAFLLEKRDSRVYHGFAIIAQQRFRDAGFAEELFKIAQRLPNRAASLNGDHGRSLLLAKRPADARPLLEQAVKDTPNSPVVWADLTFARLLTGDTSGACDATQEVMRRSPPDQVLEGIKFVRSKLECK